MVLGQGARGGEGAIWVVRRNGFVAFEQVFAVGSSAPGFSGSFCEQRLKDLLENAVRRVTLHSQ